MNIDETQFKDLSNSSTLPKFNPSFNVSPSSTIPILVSTSSGNTLILHKWGINLNQTHLINARTESLIEKNFWKSFKRCIIFATGFYEWKNESGRKVPYYATPISSKVFKLAGLYDAEGFVILTCEPSLAISAVHNRMPVCLDEEDVSRWLNGKSYDMLKSRDVFVTKISRVGEFDPLFGKDGRNEIMDAFNSDGKIEGWIKREQNDSTFLSPTKKIKTEVAENREIKNEIKTEVMKEIKVEKEIKKEIKREINGKKVVIKREYIDLT